MTIPPEVLKRATKVNNETAAAPRKVDIKGHRAPPADILIAGDTIAEIGPPGLAAPAHTLTQVAVAVCVGI